MSTLGERVRLGDGGAIGRLITLLERGDPAALAVADELYEFSKDARLIGITGPPGAGKSTMVGQLVRHYRTLDHRVAVLAVDPSSHRTGGALLGDRVRMGEDLGDDGTFMRSLASRTELGGLSTVVRPAARVLAAAGYDRILIETVGVGQNEIAVSTAVDCTILVSIPGAGDGLQTLKAGVFEIGDIHVVNKSDREGADKTKREISAMLGRQPRAEGITRPSVYMTRADTGDGVRELIDAVEMFLESQVANGLFLERRLEQLAIETLDLVIHEITKQVLPEGRRELDGVSIDALATGLRSPASIAAGLVADLVNSLASEPTDSG